MSQLRILFLTSLTLLCLGACSSHTAKEATNAQATTQSSAPNITEVSSENPQTSRVTPISLREIPTLLAQDQSFYLYLGRETCHYCQIFQPKLEDALKTSTVPVYYVDGDKEDPSAFRQFANRFGIHSTPNLSQYRGTQLLATLEGGSQATISDIQHFLNQDPQ